MPRYFGFTRSLSLLVVVCFSFANSARAAAVYSATATSVTSAVTVTEGLVSSTNTPGSSFSGTSGTGLVTSLTGFNAAGFGVQSVATGGSAALPRGSAFSAYEVHDFVELKATSLVGATAVLDFDFDFTAFISASAAAIGELAGASYNFHITGADDEAGEALFVDAGSGFVAVSDFEVDDFVDAMGPGALTTDGVTGMVKIKYTGAAMGFGGDGEYAFSIFTRVSGGALAIPEPGSLAVWSMLLAGMTCWYRRRRQR